MLFDTHKMAISVENPLLRVNNFLQMSISTRETEGSGETLLILKQCSEKLSSGKTITPL